MKRITWTVRNTTSAEQAPSRRYTVTGTLLVGLTAATFVTVSPVTRADRTWEMQWELKSPDPEDAVTFGNAVALQDDTLVVADSKAYVVAGFQGWQFCGRIFVYDFATGAMLLEIQPTRPEPNLNFGRSLALDGDYVAVGAVEEVHIVNVVLGSLKRLIDPPGNRRDSDFGRSVALDGRILLAGAPLDDTAGVDAGTAWIVSSRGLGQEIELRPTDPPLRPGDRYGSAVALSPNWIVIGAPGNAPNPESFGRVFVFDRSTLELARVLESPAMFGGDGFGQVLALQGDALAVPANSSIDDRTIFVFDLTTGDVIDEIEPLTGNGVNFARAVALDRATVVAGTDRLRGNFDCTGAAIFNVPARRQVGLLSAPQEPEPRPGFGQAVALDRERIVVGRPFPSRSSAPSVYTYVPAVASAPVLTIDGGCGEALELVATGCTPNAPTITFVGGGGPVWLPMVPNCPTFQLDFGRARLEGIAAVADSNGETIVTVELPPYFCANAQIQVLDQITCLTSNIARP